jgi:5'-nucleotidase
MRALVTNDDGIDSPGLHLLARLAVEAGLEVVVAAPDQEYSGSSASLTALAEDGRLLMHERQLDGR